MIELSFAQLIANTDKAYELLELILPAVMVIISVVITNRHNRKQLVAEREYSQHKAVTELVFKEIDRLNRLMKDYELDAYPLLLSIKHLEQNFEQVQSWKSDAEMINKFSEKYQETVKLLVKKYTVALEAFDNNQHLFVRMKQASNAIKSLNLILLKGQKLSQEIDFSNLELKWMAFLVAQDASKMNKAEKELIRKKLKEGKEGLELSIHNITKLSKQLNNQSKLLKKEILNDVFKI